ncbi:hypothetical protein [Chamaesiphon sp. VAR_48_metabat_135_sub]|uniref:hypothetical protein n=1 Tax=Chamaesiphon sp. VAR_48_metabat_135_sub TaxID=2964699 RepID=UPI002869F04D|nr:hypothetical protein [Chamaesiphon sp. VAR_48_metabat_135_sub]
MPERAINTKSATGCLLILLPAALAMSALFVAWPFILGITVLLAGGNIWQSYEWSKTTRSIDPVFQQLIVQNRGEITPIDLSLKANVSGNVSQKYLAAKAGEFGTGSRQHPDRGQVYYFVSISTLGSIFDDSEREAPEIMPATNPVVALAPVPTPSVPEVLLPSVSIPPVLEIVSPISPVVAEVTAPPESPPAPPAGSNLSGLGKLFDEESAPTSAAVEPLSVADTATAPLPNIPLVTIIQSELAKRLDVHSSTIYKRRGEPDFTDWTRNRDPEGLAWGYAEATKEYYRVDT